MIETGLQTPNNDYLVNKCSERRGTVSAMNNIIKTNEILFDGHGFPKVGVWGECGIESNML